MEILCEEDKAEEAAARLDRFLKELSFVSPVEEGRTYLELLLRKGKSHG